MPARERHHDGLAAGRQLKRALALAAVCACAHGQKAAGGGAWISVESEHFRVRTDFPEDAARELARGLEETRSVMLQVVWPGLSGPAGRLQVVAVADPDVVREATSGSAVGFVRLDPFLQPMVVVSDAGEGGQTVARHELAHALANHFLVRQPHWLAEGLASYLETIDLDHEAGRAIVGRMQQARLQWAQHDSAAYHEGVLAVGPEYGDLRGEEQHRFYAASWILVHYLIDERRDGLNAYAARLAHGEDPRKAFAAQFPDLTDDAIERELRDYKRGKGTFPEYSVPLPRTAPAMRVEPLDLGEALALRASLYRKGARGREQAVSAALRADPANPLALALADGGDAASATRAHPGDWRAWFLLWIAKQDRKALEKAAQLSPKNGPVLAELSIVRAKAGRPDEALALALQSATLAPGSWRSLDALAWAWAGKKRCKEALAAGNRSLEVLAEGVPAELLAHARARFLDLQSRCGQKPGRVELAEETAADIQPVRKQCGPTPKASARGPLTADYLVREDGSVGDVTVTGDAAASVLRAFEEFVKSCRYQPATKDGKPTAVRLRQDLSIRAR